MSSSPLTTQLPTIPRVRGGRGMRLGEGRTGRKGDAKRAGWVCPEAVCMHLAASLSLSFSLSLSLSLSLYTHAPAHARRPHSDTMFA